MKKIILITGTSKGLGSYLCEYYSKRGETVIGCSRSKSNYISDNYFHHTLDISRREQIKTFFKDIRNKYGRLDVLINNGAINPQISPFLLISDDTLEKTFKTNFFSAYYMSQEAVKLMKINNYGRIINIGSMAEKLCVSGESVYTSTKSALTGFTKVIAKEVYKMGITCNVVSPSAIETDLMKGVNREALNKVLQNNAIPEIGKMEDVSNIIDFLIKSESSSITGQVIYLGGV